MRRLVAIVLVAALIVSLHLPILGADEPKKGSSDGRTAAGILGKLTFQAGVRAATGAAVGALAVAGAAVAVTFTSSTIDKRSGMPPAKPTPAKPTPAKPTPAKPTPAKPTPAKPTPAKPTPAK